MFLINVIDISSGLSDIKNMFVVQFKIPSPTIQLLMKVFVGKATSIYGQLRVFQIYLVCFRRLYISGSQPRGKGNVVVLFENEKEKSKQYKNEI